MSRDFSAASDGPEVTIDAEGVWHVDGRPVVHPTVIAELVERLAIEADGRYVLRAGGGAVPVGVAEAPFVVRTLEVRRGADGRIERLEALLSDGTEEALEASTLRRVEDRADGPGGAPVACAVKGGRFEARLSRFATYQLLAEAEAAPDGRARLETAGGPILL